MLIDLTIIRKGNNKRENQKKGNHQHLRTANAAVLLMIKQKVEKEWKYNLTKILFNDFRNFLFGKRLVKESGY